MLRDGGRRAPAGAAWPAWPPGWRPSADRLGVARSRPGPTATRPTSSSGRRRAGGRGVLCHRRRRHGPAPAYAPATARVGRLAAADAAAAEAAERPARTSWRAGARWWSTTRSATPWGWRGRAAGGRTGRPVVLVTGDLVAGTQLSRTGDLAPANARLARAGVRVVKGSVVRRGARRHRCASRTATPGSKDERAGRPAGRGRTYGCPTTALGDAEPGVAGPATRWPPARSTRPCSRAAGPRWPLDEPARAAGERDGGRYQLLFTPLRLGPVVVRNRIVFSAHLTNYAEDGRPSEQHAAYYGARAAGGAGLIITEEHSTHPTDWPYEKLIHGFHATSSPGYRRITEAVHRHDTPIFAQINHNGGQGSGMYSRLPVWAPSPVPDPLFREVPKAVTAHEIARDRRRVRPGGRPLPPGWLRRHRAAVLALVHRPGLPVAGHQPSAPTRYGGSLENRSPSAPGDRGGRPRGHRPRPGPRGPAVRRRADRGRHDHRRRRGRGPRWSRRPGQVDYVNTSIGVATATLYMIEASMQVPPAYALWIASALRKAVSLPVVGVGRFKDPLQADRALAEGHADLIGVVRGQIADADFAAKARAGERDGHPQLPLVQPGVRGPDGAQPVARAASRTRGPGRESEPLPVPPAAAGRCWSSGPEPAGLQAAIAAARAGHRSTSTRPRPCPGGQVRVAATVPSRAELGRPGPQPGGRGRTAWACAFHLRDPGRRGAGGRAGDPTPWSWPPGPRPDRPWWAGDADAGGRRPRRPRGPGPARPAGCWWSTSWASTRRPAWPSCWPTGAARSRSSPRAWWSARTSGITLDMETWWMKATAKGIDPDHRHHGHRGVRRRRGRRRVGGDPAAAHHRGRRPRAVDWVVCATPPRADDELWRALVGAGRPVPAVHRVGDCVAPRRAHAAVIEGERVGAAL